MVVCKFWQQGNCRFGERCRYEHPSKNLLQTQNRFGVFQSPESTATKSPASGAFQGSFPSHTLPYYLNKDIIISDLSKERPIWVLSAYGPGRDAPTQLFGGLPREQSFEEMRLHHYLAAASGNQTQAILEAQNLVNNAEQQIQSALRDVNGAINYIIDGVKTHPNRIDICKRQPGNAPNQAPALALSQLSGPAPNRPSVFGVPSAITGPQPGASSNLGNLTSNSGQPPSVFGKPSAFGIPQPINLTQPSTAFSNPSSAFDRPSTSSGGPPAPFGAPPLGGTGPAFGGNTAFGGTNPTPSAFAIPQPVPPAAAPSVSPFVQPTNPFGRSQQLAQPSAFGMPANTPPSNPIGQPPAPTTNGSIFGKPQSGQPPTANGPSVQRDDQNKLTVWHGRPVSYIDGDPCYKRRDGTWEKIWFPNGPLTSHSDTQLPDEAYDEKTKEAYIFMKEHKAFKDGIMPEIPPKREWCSWDF